MDEKLTILVLLTPGICLTKIPLPHSQGNLIQAGSAQGSAFHHTPSYWYTDWPSDLMVGDAAPPCVAGRMLPADSFDAIVLWTFYFEHLKTYIKRVNQWHPYVPPLNVRTASILPYFTHIHSHAHVHIHLFSFLAQLSYSILQTLLTFFKGHLKSRDIFLPPTLNDHI